MFVGVVVVVVVVVVIFDSLKVILGIINLREIIQT